MRCPRASRRRRRSLIDDADAFSPSRIPKLGTSCRRATRALSWRRSVDPGDERRLVVRKKRSTRGKVATNARARSGNGAAPTMTSRATPVSHHGVTLVRFVSNSTIMSGRDPAALAHRFKPGLIRRIRREMICVPFDGETARSENFGEAFPEVAIGEVDEAQAARSQRAACSTSQGPRS